ncbi:MAG: hypothetical protein HY815_21415, partial [Candidatus Riflebacteria bacterium]|nr:hypothetical protein [Candidatus Riflebacteria bacterium]
SMTSSHLVLVAWTWWLTTPLAGPFRAAVAGPAPDGLEGPLGGLQLLVTCLACAGAIDGVSRAFESPRGAAGPQPRGDRQGRTSGRAWMLKPAFAMLVLAGAAPALAVSARAMADSRFELDNALAHHPDYHDRFVFDLWPASAGEPQTALSRPGLTDRVVTASGSASHHVVYWGSHQKLLTVAASTPASIALRSFSGPHWRASIDGEPVPIRTDNPCLAMQIDLPPGDHEVEVRYHPGPGDAAGRAVSLVVLGILILRSRPPGSTTRRSSRSPVEACLWIVATALVTWSVGYTVMRGSDLFWHLAAGRLIVQTGSLPAVDPWSFTRAGAAWLNHEWVADVVYHLWAIAGGTGSLVFWKWAVCIATWVALLLGLERITGSWPTGFVWAAWSAVAASPFLDLRPHLYSLLFTSLLVLLTLHRARPPLLLPVLFTVWANLHGGFFFGLMALAAIGSGRVLHRCLEAGRGASGPVARLWAGTWVACALAACLNPAALSAFAYPLKYALDPGSPFRSLAEWRAPFVPGTIQAPLCPATIVLFVAGLDWLIASRGWLLFPHLWPAAGLGLLTLAMALTSRRFIPLFCLCASVTLATAQVSLLGRRRVDAASRPALRLAAPLLVLLLAAIRLGPHPRSARAFSPMIAESGFPVPMPRRSICTGRRRPNALPRCRSSSRRAASWCSGRPSAWGWRRGSWRPGGGPCCSGTPSP